MSKVKVKQLNNLHSIVTCKCSNIYFINTNEIPSELSREHLISSHVKITCPLM